MNDVPRDVKQQTTGSAGEEGNESSTAMEADVIILVEIPAPAQSQRALSVNDVPRDVKQRTVGLENPRDGDPERKVVSFTLVLNHLCSARMFPMSVLSVVY